MIACDDTNARGNVGAETLLLKLISGELRVKDVERFGGEGDPMGETMQLNTVRKTVCYDQSLNRFRGYIVSNSMQWAVDRENPSYVEAKNFSPLPKDEPWCL